MKVFFNYYMSILRYGWVHAISQVKDKAFLLHFKKNNSSSHSKP